MAEIKRSILFGKLNPIAYKAVESATIFCKMRGNPYVELVHWLNQIFQLADSDLHKIIKHFGLNTSRLATDLTTALDKLPRGATSISDFSPHLEEAVERGWVFGSLLFGENRVRTGHVVVALLKTPSLRSVFLSLSKEFSKIKLETLTDGFAQVTAGSPEESLGAADQAGAAGVAPGETSGAMAPAAMGKQEALARFSVDLTEKARKGEIDPILGRDEEIRQIVDILMRRRQNNPILTGEAGVGKTAVVEGFALRIAAGDVPPALKEVSLRTLDLGLLQAGASMKGEFENRLRSVIDETQSSRQKVILFIDEAHMLIGAGNGAGQGDAANLLKPALARGALRVIAATTWAEYKKYFEKDAALTRRFQVVKVEEPSEPIAIAMIRGLVSTLEKHHKVRILDEAVSEAVRLSARYIPSRQLPDKAVSLIDTACARVSMSQAAVPPAIEDRERRISLIDTEVAILDREMASGENHGERREALLAERTVKASELVALHERWEQEKALATEITDIRSKIESPEDTADKDVLREKLTATSKQLRELQGEEPLIYPVVDGVAVSEVVAGWTGIPMGRMQSNEIRTVLNLRETMEHRIVGQSHALEAVAQAIQTSRAGLTDPRKPIGVFLMVGTSGTGKTETALTLADLLYGGEQNMTTINMTEFKEEHKVSLLMGSPPGYVGYGEGGVLTEAVRRRPYSVILLDEMEKAHPGVQDIFFQVFDKGNMKDGEGRDIDFKNTVIIMTSNAGTDLITKLFADPETAPDAAGLAEALRPELAKYFKPAFLGRGTLVPYFPLPDAIIRQIVVMQLERIRGRVLESYRATFDWAPELVEMIAARCTESSSGARNVENILTRTLLPELSGEVLARLADGETIRSVHAGIKSDGLLFFAINKP